MKKLTATILILITVLSAAILGSCSGENEYPVTVDGITINEEPENIVVLNKNLADIISCIGYDVKLVGRSDEVNQKGMSVVPSIGSCTDASDASIIKLNADIVFADETFSSQTKKKLEDKGITVVIPDKTNTPKQIKNIYKQLGAILGGNITGKAQGTDSFNTLYSELKDVKSAIDEKNVIRTVCYLYSENGVLKTMNNATWGGNILDFTGATNVFHNSDNNTVNSDSLMLSNPDYIFCSDKKVVKYLKTNKTFKRLTALKKHTYIIPLDEINMQGDTSLDTLKKMLKKMYPEEFT